MTEGMSVADVLALSRTNEHDSPFGGGSGFLWVILIFLFFLAFSGGNGFGNWGNNTNGSLSQIERDVLTTSCGTQKEVIESRYTTQLGFQGLQAQIAECCCEIKNTVHAEGEATRALITQNTIQELRDNLQAAQLQLGNVSQTQALINTLRPFPVPSYPTCSPYESIYGCARGCGYCGTI